MNKRYISGIDGLRSLAVILVIGYHLLPHTFQGGYLGVVLFFVLSGYLITDTLYQLPQVDLKQFYWKRIKRLWPSLIVLFIISGYLFIIINPDSLADFGQTIASTFLGFNNFWQLHADISYFDQFSQTNSFKNLWSLAIEFQFYLIWPIIFILYRKLSSDEKMKKLSHYLLSGAFISLLLMVIMYNPQNINRVYYGTDTRIFAILIGCALAMAIHANKTFIQKLLHNKYLYQLTLLASIILVVMSFTLSDKNMFTYLGGMFVYSLLSAWILLLVIKSRVVNNLLTNKYFTWIGKRSYEIYLWQLPIISVYSRLFDVAEMSWLHIIIQIIVILLLADFTYKVADFIRHVDWIKTIKNIANNHKKIGLAMLVLVISFSLIIVKGEMMDRSGAKALESKLEDKQQKLAQHQKELKKSSKESKKIKIDKKASFKQQAKKLEYSAIGDSVLLDASEDLVKLSPKADIDAKVGRQFYESVDLFKQYHQNKKLKDVVVIALGTNGSVKKDELTKIIKSLKGKEIILVNTNVPRPWEKSVNKRLKAFSKKYDNCHLVDWHSYSKNHPEWFESDAVHMNKKGSEAYAKFLTKEIIDIIK